MRTGYASSGSQFDFVMRTGWHPHPVVKFFKYDNRMRVSSGSHNKIKLRTGWTGYSGVKCFKYNNWMRVPSGCHYEIKLKTKFVKDKIKIKFFY